MFRPVCPAMKLRRGRNAAFFALRLLPSLAPVPLNPRVGGNGCRYWSLLPAPPFGRCAGLVSRRCRCAPFAGTVVVLPRCLALRAKDEKRVGHARVRGVTGHAPALIVVSGRAAVPVPPTTKPKRCAGFLMDRYWTGN